MSLRIILLTTAAAAVFTMPAYAQQVSEQVVVYGTLPGSTIGLAPDKVPGSLQSLRRPQPRSQFPFEQGRRATRPGGAGIGSDPGAR